MAPNRSWSPDSWTELLESCRSYIDCNVKLVTKECTWHHVINIQKSWEEPNRDLPWKRSCSPSDVASLRRSVTLENVKVQVGIRLSSLSEICHYAGS